MPKGKSGIKRAKNPDVTYKVEAEIVVKYDKNGHAKWGVKSNNEPFKAIYEAPVGTRISVKYIHEFKKSEYIIGMHGSSTKTLQLIVKEGKPYQRPYYIRSMSDVKKHINPLGATEITIHGRSK